MRAGLQAVLGSHGTRWVDHLDNSHYHNNNINNNNMI